MDINPNSITPQSFETNDGRIQIEVSDDGFLKLTVTNLSSDQSGYYNDDVDWVQNIEFNFDDLDIIIEILNKAKQINPYSYDSLKNKYKEEFDDDTEYCF